MILQIYETYSEPGNGPCVGHPKLVFRDNLEGWGAEGGGRTV